MNLSYIRGFFLNPIYLNLTILFVFFLLLHLIYRNDPLLRIILYVVIFIYCFYLFFKNFKSEFEKEFNHTKLGKINRVIYAFIAFHLIFMIGRFNQGHVADIGDTTLKSAQLLFSAINPYKTDIDTVALSYMGPGFGGFKYLPIMTLVYAPLGLLFDYRGIQLTNFILNLSIGYLIFDIVKEKIGNDFYSKISTILYFSPFLIFSLLYAKGVTDLAPVLFVLLAFKFRDKHALSSGLLLGLSISSKLLPGLLLIPILLKGKLQHRYVVGGVIGLIPIYLVAISSPEEFWNNIILFNLARPIAGDSWFLLLPDSGLVAIKFILYSIIVLIYFYSLIKTLDIEIRFILSTIVLISAIFLSSDFPQNYNLWWIPLIICGCTIKIYRSSNHLI